MRDVYVIGIGMTPFQRQRNRSVADLAAETVQNTLADAGIIKESLQAVWFSNSTWGIFAGQHCIRGQVALGRAGICGVPITNVENSCAGGATAFHMAWLGVVSGAYDCTLAIGVEAFDRHNREKVLESFWSALDVEKRVSQIENWKNAANILSRSRFSKEVQEEIERDKNVQLEIFSSWARWHMGTYGSTQEQLAAISAKNHFNGKINPLAYSRLQLNEKDVLNQEVISWPLTSPMCAPLCNGGAAVILCSKEFLKRVESTRKVRVRASVLGSGTEREIWEEDKDIAKLLARQAYEKSGIGPKEIDLAELHDATAFGELHLTEALEFCGAGEGGIFAESGATKIGGSLPINTSGGLEARGHPVGATGLAQIYELVTQLRGEAGDRQVENARIGLAQNGGGNVNFEEASMCINMLEKA